MNIITMHFEQIPVPSNVSEFSAFSALSEASKFFKSQARAWCSTMSSFTLPFKYNSEQDNVFLMLAVILSAKPDCAVIVRRFENEHHLWLISGPHEFKLWEGIFKDHEGDYMLFVGKTYAR